MLLQFSVTNYACFRERTTLSFLAAEGVDHPPGSVVTVPGVGDVLRLVALYGANASGKSRWVSAIDMLSILTYMGVRPGKPFPREGFRWAGDAGETTWEVIWAGPDRRVFSFGLSIAVNGDVAAEWLTEGLGSAAIVVFERDGASITFGPGLRVSDERTAFYRFVAEGTRREQVFAAELRERNAWEVWRLLDTLEVDVVGPKDSRMAKFEPRNRAMMLASLLSNAETRRRVDAWLSRSDVGLDRVALDTNRPSWADAWSRGVELDYGEVSQAIRSGDAKARLKFVGRLPDGTEAEFGEHEVSAGTWRLVELLTELDAHDGEEGVVSVVDEIESSLHPLLVRALVQSLLDVPAGQVVFTTHDSHLLDAGLLPPDAVWMVEKGADGASSLRSLVEVRRDQLDRLQGSLERAYLAGRFGGVPVIAER